MATDMITVMYIILGSVFGIALLAVVMVIAGKDILIAFQRRFSKRGCDVYVANLERTISHFFMTPKDGVFKINKVSYVTNPEKTKNLTEE